MRILAGLLLATFALAPPAFAQGGEAPPLSVRLGGRLGAFEGTGAADSYDAVFGEPMPQLGVALELGIRRRLLLTLSYDYGRVKGEQVLPTTPPRGTGEGETLTYQPLSLTAAWLFNPEAPWQVYAGLGATLLTWKDEGATASASGSDTGGHAVFGLRRGAGRWVLGGELRYSTIPDAVGEAGITRFFGEDDLGGVALHFVALAKLR